MTADTVELYLPICKLSGFCESTQRLNLTSKFVQQTVFKNEVTNKCGMASSEHLFSSHFVKSVHQHLRDQSKVLGVEEAWQKHCENEENLKKYASAMRDLADYHWEENYKKNAKAVSRVQWIHNFCQRYFTEEEISKHRQRETEVANKMSMEIGQFNLDLKLEKYRLLDVGSCYNPFKKYKCFDVIPVDIAPAINDVYKCDFLNLKLTTSVCDVNSLEIRELQEQSFDVIVFSLLLEYLPSPQQRHLCCEKAYCLLKREGILIIITPDSKHVGANAKIMKSWRFILAKLGFSRIKYEKLSYLHCMVFRRSLRPEVAQRWASLQNADHFYNEIVIPQDFKRSEQSSTDTNSNNSCDVSLFQELAFGD
jgi:25S rRNA (adenine2142-N1)-methyltransferase